MATTNKYTPFYPIHPGEIIKDELEARKISQKEFAKRLGMQYSMLNEILNSKRSVTVTIALMFEAALGIEAETFVNMQTRYNLQVARQDEHNNQLMENIRHMCAAVL